MSGFQPVNTSLAPDDHLQSQSQSHDVTTPTTPRPNSSSASGAKRRAPMDESSPTTPTRNSFGGLPGQKALPGSPFSSPSAGRPGTGGSSNQSPPSRNNSNRSAHSKDSEDVDMDMDDSDDAQDGSDDESVGGDPSKPSKKKKGQRFFCTEFPPCNLSFTRSEHLARHIRKHTGERPFQCHCSRRFSRLDNLRQHAQTVHCNEEIPGDSLAATGTRFQRQIRTDRVRPQGARSRASTAGSQSSHGRGHSRNLSSSSIGSTASSVSLRGDDVRRRPPPLMMATDPAARGRLTVDTFRSPAPDSPGANRDIQFRGYSTQSSGGFSTPTSATFSAGTGSPRFSAHQFQSPPSNMSRSIVWDSRAPGRRLSVPSGPNPFQFPQGGGQNQPYFSPLASTSTSTMSGNSSFLGSPTSSTFSPGREFASRAAQDAEYKRRTWHPTTRTTFQSPLADHSTTYPPTGTHRPLFAAQTVPPHEAGTTLPGIESFDHVNHRQTTPPRRAPSPMQIDRAGARVAPGGPPSSEQTLPPQGHRRAHSGWDMSLHQNLTRLDITSTPPKEPALPWTEPHHETHQQQHGPPPQRPVSSQMQYQPLQGAQHAPPQSMSQPPGPQPETGAARAPPQTPRNNRSKRHGWYQGPLSAHQGLNQHRPSPEDSSSSDGVHTPSTSSVGEYQPSIVHSNGWVESSSGGPAEEANQNYPAASGHPSRFPIETAPGSTTEAETQGEPPKRDGDMLRLEALVAVATSEDKSSTL